MFLVYQNSNNGKEYLSFVQFQSRINFSDIEVFNTRRNAHVYAFWQAFYAACHKMISRPFSFFWLEFVEKDDFEIKELRNK